MPRLWTLAAAVVSMLLVSGSAFAQDNSETSSDDEPSGMVGQAPGSETESTSSSTSSETSKAQSTDMPQAREQTAATDTGGETDSNAGHPGRTSSLVAAPHVGVSVPAFSDLGTWGNFGLELGYLPPIDGRPLEIGLIGQYSQPGASGSSTDQHLGKEGAQYSWDLTHQILTLDLVGLWRFRTGSGLAPYGFAGPRMNLMKATMTAEGNGGNRFGEAQETNTEFGMVVGGGVDYELGPGTLFGELKFGWTNLQQRLTGDSNTGSFLLDVGYRFYFL